MQSCVGLEVLPGGMTDVNTAEGGEAEMRPEAGVSSEIV